MTPRILADNPLALVQIDDDHGVVTLTRTERPIDLELLEKVTLTFATILPVPQRASLGMLFDMRKSPLSKPETEQRLFEFANEIQRGFLASATVLATAVGKLQVNRIRREGRGVTSYLAASMEDARAHLEGLVREHRAATLGTRGRR